MFKRLGLVILASSLLLTGCERGALLADGSYAPKDNWQGQWRIVNIWADWCKPCWQEIPELNHFYALQDSAFNQSAHNVRLLGWNFDEAQGAELAALVEKMNIQFPVLEQWPKEWPQTDIKGLPATIIITPDNRLHRVLWGPQTNAALHGEIEKALQ